MNPLLVLAIVVAGIVVIAALRLWRLYKTKLDQSSDLAAASIRLESANLSFVRSLPATLAARDQHTAARSGAVAVYARDIANQLRLPEEQQQLAHLCGLLHDIGKIGLPPDLLEKPGALTLAERRVMETHPELGAQILARVEGYDEIAKIVRHHHERWDGQGYPDRLAGEVIPLISRIVAVAEAYHSMTSDRPYAEAMPSRVARLRLAQDVETQFDGRVVAAFEAILAEAGQDYRFAAAEDFVLASSSESELPPSDPDAVVGRAFQRARRLHEVSGRLHEVSGRLHEVSGRDSLTGLHNRHYFHETLAHEVQRAHRFDRRLSLIFFDIDDFGQINEELGHLGADGVLEELAQRLRSVVHGADIPCRVGGDEFAVILPESTIEEAERLFQRLQLALQGQPTGRISAVRLSVGIAELARDDDATSFFWRVDQALYRDKREPPSAGVREPRRPKPSTGSGSAEALPAVSN